MENTNDNNDNLSKNSDNNRTEEAISRETDTATTKTTQQDKEVQSINDTKNAEVTPDIDYLAHPSVRRPKFTFQH